MKVPLDMEVGLDTIDTQLLPPQKGAEPPIFGSCLLWPNGCVDQDAT